MARSGSLPAVLVASACASNLASGMRATACHWDDWFRVMPRSASLSGSISVTSCDAFFGLPAAFLRRFVSPPASSSPTRRSFLLHGLLLLPRLDDPADLLATNAVVRCDLFLRLTGVDAFDDPGTRLDGNSEASVGSAPFATCGIRRTLVAIWPIEPRFDTLPRNPQCRRDHLLRVLFAFSARNALATAFICRDPLLSVLLGVAIPREVNRRPPGRADAPKRPPPYVRNGTGIAATRNIHHESPDGHRHCQRPGRRPCFCNCDLAVKTRSRRPRRPSKRSACHHLRRGIGIAPDQGDSRRGAGF